MHSSLPKTLYSTAEVRDLDHIAITRYAIPGLTLMQRAAQAAYKLLRTKWPHAKKILVLCGSGHNGGDGYCLAALAKADGLTVEIQYLGDARRMEGDVLEVATRCADMAPRAWCGISDQQYDVIVDALLGSGLERMVDGKWRQVIDAINDQNAPVLSLDIASGLHADTGHIMGVAVRADATISFVGLKRGLFTGDGVMISGEVYFSSLDIPDNAYTKVKASAERIALDDFRRRLLPRSPSSHKGDYGHVLVVGGDHGFCGAARLCAEAAARVGSGLISVATRKAHAMTITSAVPEIMSHAVTDIEDMQPLQQRATTIALGPGLGQSPWSVKLFAAALDSKLPLVVDADALNLLAREPTHSTRWTLTPHPGEAARLLGVDTKAIQADRFAAARDIQRKFGGVVVLKGSGTIVADATLTFSICGAGNPGMASGGMGDVLTGVIAGLLAQRDALPMEDADIVRLGVCLHAAAGDSAAMDAPRGLLASDVIGKLRGLVNVTA